MNEIKYEIKRNPGDNLPSPYQLDGMFKQNYYEGHDKYAFVVVRKIKKMDLNAEIIADLNGIYAREVVPGIWEDERGHELAWETDDERQDVVLAVPITHAALMWSEGEKWKGGDLKMEETSKLVEALIISAAALKVANLIGL